MKKKYFRYTDPVNRLQLGLREILQSSSSKNSETRRIAVRWFNRLYYDIGKFNKRTILSLSHYPDETLSRQNYSEFIIEIKPIFEELSNRGNSYRGEIQSELCARINFLHARFQIDFKWLRDEDYEKYVAIEELVGQARRTRHEIITLWDDICNFLEYVLKSSPKWGCYDELINKKDEFIEWHNANRDKIREEIHKYKENSKVHVKKLHDIAEAAGVVLLSVEEYEAVINADGSKDERIIIIGEVSMRESYSFNGSVGQVNIKSNLKGSDNLNHGVITSECERINKKSSEVQCLIDELEGMLAKLGEKYPEEAERILHSAKILGEETKKTSPDTGFLNISCDGLKHAAKAVKDIAPNVLDVALKISSIFSK